MSGASAARRDGRPVAASVLVVVGSIALVVALTVGWAQRSVFDDREFAARAVSLLDSAAVRYALAEEISDQIVENGSSTLASYRSALVALVDDALATSGFRAIFRGALRQAHHAVFQRDGAAALLELGETLELVSANARATNASLASQLPSDAGSLLVDVTPTVRRLEPWRFARDARVLDEVALLLALFTFGGAIALDRRRRTIVLIGVGVASAGALVLLLAEAIPPIAVTTVDDPALSDAISDGVARFVGDLRAVGLWTIPLGAIVVAAAEAGERSGTSRLRAALDRLRRFDPAAAGRPAQLATGVGAVAVGIMVLVLRDRLVSFALLLVGLFVLYRGATFVIRALLGPEPEPDAPATRRARHRLLAASVGVVAVILLGTGLVVAVGSARRAANEREVLRCNGSAHLCDRRLDEVAFAASHNSMSAESDPGWLFAQNRHGIPAQLQYGIRGFLVKTHYGIATGITFAGAPLVVTDRSAEIAYDRDAEAAELGPEAVSTVRRIDREIGRISGTPELYLCHGYCELGATKLSATLAAMKGFMDRNPHEVLIMVIGDYVTPEDTARAFRQAGLVDRLWTYDHDRRPPTLRRMIEARRPLLVLSEHHGGRPRWYNPAYSARGLLQDTPFTFPAPRDFSCAPNRGSPSAPLFQVNHWITDTSPPSARQAKSVNAYRALLRRVRACARERDRFPSIVGVNFYDEGGLLRVVDRLNER